jgi:hypothetical protein
MRQLRDSGRVGQSHTAVRSELEPEPTLLSPWPVALAATAFLHAQMPVPFLFPVGSKCSLLKWYASVEKREHGDQSLRVSDMLAPT